MHYPSRARSILGVAIQVPIFWCHDYRHQSSQSLGIFQSKIVITLYLIMNLLQKLLIYSWYTVSDKCMPLAVLYAHREFILPVAICYGIFQVDEEPYEASNRNKSFCIYILCKLP